jgi:hypothetical protein
MQGGWQAPEGMSLASLAQWLPNVDVQSMGNYARPQVSAGYALPVGGGTVSIDGRYQPLPQGRPELGATIGYKRQF